MPYAVLLTVTPANTWLSCIPLEIFALLWFRANSSRRIPASVSTCTGRRRRLLLLLLAAETTQSARRATRHRRTWASSRSTSTPRPPVSCTDFQSVSLPACTRSTLSPRPMVGSIMRCYDPSVSPSDCLSVSDSLAFARWRLARVAVSHAFDRGQHDGLCSCPNAISGGESHIVSSRDICHPCLLL